MLKSVGITPKGFKRMLNYESIFTVYKGSGVWTSGRYSCHAPAAQGIDSQVYLRFSVSIGDICVVIAAVFVIVGTAMLYSSRKVRKENIIDALKQEII